MVTCLRLRHALQLSWGFSRRLVAELDGGCGESGDVRRLVLAPEWVTGEA